MCPSSLRLQFVRMPRYAVDSLIEFSLTACQVKKSSIGHLQVWDMTAWTIEIWPRQLKATSLLNTDKYTAELWSRVEQSDETSKRLAIATTQSGIFRGWNVDLMIGLHALMHVWLPFLDDAVCDVMRTHATTFWLHCMPHHFRLPPASLAYV